MRIYKLIVNQVHSQSGSMLSSQISPRTLSKTEYFLNLEKAQSKRDEIIKGVELLAGYMPSLEIDIIPVEVNE